MSLSERTSLLNAEAADFLNTSRQYCNGRGLLRTVMTIEVAKGVRDRIDIHERDNPFDLARAFQLKHRLTDQARDVVHQKICESLDPAKHPLCQHTDPPSRNESREGHEFPPEDQNGTLQKRHQAVPMQKTFAGISRFEQCSEVGIKSSSLLESDANPKQKENTPMSKKDFTSKKSQRSNRSITTEQLTSRLFNESRSKFDFLKGVEKKATDKLKNQAEGLSQCKYTPSINEVSEVLASDRRKAKKIEDYLYDQTQTLEKKLEMKRNIKEDNLKQQCTFRPAINNISRELASSRSCREQLSKQMRRVKCCQPEQPTFAPSINNISRVIAEPKGSFFERSANYEQRKSESLLRLHKQLQIKTAVLDSATGQPLFHPVISNRLIPSSRNPTNKPISEYLHELPIHHIDQLPHKLQVKTGDISEELVRNIRTKRVIYLFGELDSDQDGFISAERVCIDTLPPKVLQILTPVLFEMEEFGFQLSINEFKEAVESLTKSLNSEQKNVLFNYGRKSFC